MVKSPQNDVAELKEKKPQSDIELPLQTDVLNRLGQHSLEKKKNPKREN